MLKIRFKNIDSKYCNNFISASKCEKLDGGLFDNGRIIKADDITINVTEIDLEIIRRSYKFTSYEILESYVAFKKYLPKQFINFILNKYVDKTKLKGIKEKETEYVKAKNMFNSLYGMCVTNTIRDEVEYSNETKQFSERILDNDKIIELLEKQKEKPFLSFSWGVWVTAYARYNLITNIIKCDQFCIYADTDSMKVETKYFDDKIIKNYNNKVIKKLKNVSKILDISFDRFSPLDIKGKSHTLGLFELDGIYKKFITQGAKKYAIVNENDEIEITVAGVPKSGKNALKNIEDFRDNLVFTADVTNKKMLFYNDYQIECNLKDYQGHIEKIKQKSRNMYSTLYIRTWKKL